MMRVPRSLIVALSLSVLLQGYLIIARPLSAGPITVDSREYISIASHLVHEGTYAHDQEAPTRMRQPLYPLFLAAIWAVAGNLHPQTVAVIQAILTLGSICLIYLIGLRLFNATTAGVGAILVAVYVPLAMTSGLILTECLYTFLLLGTSYFLVRWAEENTVRAAALVGLSIGLLTLCRSTTLYLIPLLPLVLWLMSDRRGAQVRKGLLALAIAVAVLLPWGLRNYAAFGHFSVTPSLVGVAMWQGTHPDYFKYAPYGAVKILNASPEARLISQGQHYLSQGAGQRFRQAAYEHVRKDPWGVLGQGIVKVVITWTYWAGTRPWLRTAPAWYAIGVIAKVAFLALAFYGFNAAKRPGVWTILVWVVVFSAAMMVVTPVARYLIPLMPLIILGAAEVLRGWGHRLTMGNQADHAGQHGGE